MTTTENPGIAKAGMNSAIQCVFPTLFTPRCVKQNGKETGDPIYSSTFLISPDHADLKPLKAIAIAVARERWPGVALAGLKFPFADGDTEASKAKAKGKDGSFYLGNVVLKTKSKFAPAVLDGRTTPPSLTEDEKLIYSGAFTAFEVNFVAYDGVGNNPDGVTCYLNSICYAGKGPRIAGKDHSETFKGIAGRASDENPMGAQTAAELNALDDEIPF